MKEIYDETGCSVLATQVVEGAAISAYGVLDAKPVAGKWSGRLFDVHDLVEKPAFEKAPSNLAIIGRYILTPAIFEMLASTGLGSGGELQLTDGLKQLLKKEKIYGFTFEGKRHDAGDKMGFLKATVEFALKHDSLGKEFREYLQRLPLDRRG
jgi:UTP--glucose-1-phosphate uridylyltransferase